MLDLQVNDLWATFFFFLCVAHGLTFEGVLCPLKELIGGSHKEKRSYAADYVVRPFPFKDLASNISLIVKEMM